MTKENPLQDCGVEAPATETALTRALGSTGIVKLDFEPVWMPSELDIEDFQNRIKMRKPTNQHQDR